MTKKYLLLWLLFGCFWRVYAQPSPEKGKWSIEGDVFFGNILKPDDLVREILRRGLVHTYDLKVGYTDLQPSTYTSGYNYPRLGLGVSMLDCSDVKMWKEPSLGDIYALYLFFDRTLYRSKRFQFGYTLSSGPAYNTDTYDQEKAPTKIFSSSPVMIYIGYGMSLKYRLSDRLAIGANAEVKHYSNGRTGIMNKGINMAGGSLSMQYSFSPAESEYPPFVASPFKRYFYYHLMAGGGVQTYLEDLEVYWRTGPSESGLFKEKLYSKYFVSADAMYRFSSFYGCGMGVDLFYIPHTTSFRKMDEIFLGEDAAGLKYNSWSIGTAFNQELYYNQFSLTASLGYYLYRELGARKDESPLYQRFGLRYYLPKVNNLFAGFAIKAHEFSKAEYFEFSVGKKF